MPGRTVAGRCLRQPDFNSQAPHSDGVMAAEHLSFMFLSVPSLLSAAASFRSIRPRAGRATARRRDARSRAGRSPGYPERIRVQYRTAPAVQGFLSSLPKT